VEDVAGFRDGIYARGSQAWGGKAGMLEELRSSISAGHFKQAWMRQDAHEFIDKVTRVADHVNEHPLMSELRSQVLDAASLFLSQ
jgi:hypothetical protein